MAKLHVVDLGQPGIEYVAYCLEQVPGLCERVRKEIFFNGTALAPIPPSASNIRAIEFKTGGLLSQSDTREWLLDHLSNVALASEANSIVIQDIWITPDVRALARANIRRMVSNSSEVYYILKVEDLSIESINSMFQVVHSFQFFAALTKWNAAVCNSTSDIISDDDIGAITKDTVEIIVGAYDQEGVVLWRRGA